MSFEQIAALALTEDHELQERIWQGEPKQHFILDKIRCLSIIKWGRALALRNLPPQFLFQARNAAPWLSPVLVAWSPTVSSPDFPVSVPPSSLLLSSADFHRPADVPLVIEWFAHINRGTGCNDRVPSAHSQRRCH
jgi:hypothetical protein